VLSGLHRLESLIRSLEVEDLIVIPTALRRDELLEIYREWGTDKRVRVCLSSGLYELFTNGAQVREVGFIPMVSLNRTRITGVDALMKAILDFVVSLVTVVLLAPVFLVISILIRRDSPGPATYRRRVVGLAGRRFDAYKFRTMIPDADAYLKAHPELNKEWEQNGKVQDDPRITRVGRFLRRYSLDELPQLFNVLRGQMSLVGPRMITPAELKHFGRWRHNLLTVKPGMTGLWQVSGRSDLSYEERVRLDMQYIRNYTAWTDLKLIFDTVWAVLRGRGAY
jgi:exopolysaccharide biosynthesis polyprenyl glycosylphosphotransferase